VVRRAIEACRHQGEAALFVVAPRHPGRAGERVRQALRESLPIHQRATPGEELLPSGGKGGDAILLVETIGELPRFYALADLAFVGGTFGSLGGHNLFEAAEWGVPVFFGPSTEKVAEVAAALEAAGGGEAVGDGESLGRALRRLLGDPAARERAGAGALQAARQLGGALERTLRALEGWGYPLRAGGAPGRQGPAGGAVPAEAATQAAGRGAGHGAGRR